MITLLIKFLIHPILMVVPNHSKTSKAFYRILQLQQLLGLVKLEGLTTVAIILSLMHLLSVSGKLVLMFWDGKFSDFWILPFQHWSNFLTNQTGTWISLEWHHLMVPRHIVGKPWLEETMAYSTLQPLSQILIITGYFLILN